MRKHPRFLFWLIVFLTVIAILIDLPKEMHIAFTTPTLPVINKSISFQKTFYGLNPNIALGPLRIYRDLSFRKGLDLEGGVSITYKVDTSGVSPDQREAAVESAKSVIEKRINFLGTTEPSIQTATVNQEQRIIVELPGVSDVNQAIDIIGKTAQLSFWEAGATGSAMPEIDPATLPIGLAEILEGAPKKTNLTGKDLRLASVTFDQNTGGPQVSLVFSSEGAKKFADITQRNVGKRVVIVVDNEIVTYPTVNVPILDGNAVITGGFTTEQAKALSIQLNAGALPVPLSILEQRTIGPTLGALSLQKSLFAAMLGFFMVVVFMISLYGKYGAIASVALFLYTLFTLALFKLIPVTLTLAGIAGFVLSVGMAVDANILIFERVREELRRGKNHPTALELGFSRAWTSIRDSNIASIITSLVLIYFGTGIVRGFAITLLIGVVVSMFSAIVVTRTFLRMMYK